jgi:hypothetical protein
MAGSCLDFDNWDVNDQRTRPEATKTLMLGA